MYKYRSYKITTSQELFPDDFYRHMEFCEIMIDEYHDNELFLNNILFSNEKSFHLHGRHNSTVCRYWARDNLHFNIPTRTQHPQKINVCAGIIGNQIIGPFFIDGNLNGDRITLKVLAHLMVNALQNRLKDSCKSINIY